MRLIRENAIEAYSGPIDASQQGGKFTAKAQQDLASAPSSSTARSICSIQPGRSMSASCARAAPTEFGNLSLENEPIHTSDMSHFGDYASAATLDG